jgi:hypothetical protein
VIQIYVSDHLAEISVPLDARIGSYILPAGFFLPGSDGTTFGSKGATKLVRKKNTFVVAYSARNVPIWSYNNNAGVC